MVMIHYFQLHSSVCFFFAFSLDLFYPEVNSLCVNMIKLKAFSRRAKMVQHTPD